ncbi:hypothetical protein Tco_0971168 [Tanacetum coccineum]
MAPNHSLKNKKYQRDNLNVVYLCVRFDSEVQSRITRRVLDSQHAWKVISWEAPIPHGLHTLMTDEGLVFTKHIVISVLEKEIVVQMLKLKLESEEENPMADMDIPANDLPAKQAPAIAPPTRTDDQILPIRIWVPIGKSNYVLDVLKSQRNPIFKMDVAILKNTNFFRAFTASSTILAIYIQQF